MACNYNVNGTNYTREELIEKADRNKAFRRMLEQQGVEYADLLEGKEVKQPNVYHQLVQAKQFLLSSMKYRNSKIDNLKKTQPTKINKLVHEQNILEKRIKEVENDLNELREQAVSKTLDMFLESDFQRLEELVTNPNISSVPENIQEAVTIIEFFKQLGTFEYSSLDTFYHPIYTRDEIFDEDGNLMLPEEEVQSLAKWRTKAEQLESQLTANSIRAFEDTINADTNLNTITENNKLSYDEVIRNGMKDLTWFDAFAMDVSQGIFSTNGVVPGIMMNSLKESIDEEMSVVEAFEERLTEMLPRVEKALENTKKTALRESAVSYDMFFQKNEFGGREGNLVHIFSTTFFNERSRMNRLFEFEMSQAVHKASVLNLSPSSITKEIVKKRHKWYKENVMMIDIMSNPDIANAFRGTEFETLFNTSDAQNTQELKRLLGRDYNKFVSKQIDQIRKYVKHRDAILEEIQFEKDDGVITEQEATTKFEEWELANNPFRAVEYFNMPDFNTTSPSYRFNLNVPIKEKHYDSSYKEIQSDNTLYEFYELIEEMQKYIVKNLPPELREKISINHLPKIEKSILETIISEELGIMSAVSKSAKQGLKNIKDGFLFIEQSQNEKKLTNPVTGKLISKVNPAFLKEHSKELNTALNLELAEATRIFDRAINKETVTPITKLSTHEITYIMSKLPTNDIGNYLDEKGNLPIGNILEAYSKNKVLQTLSTDLPTLMRLYANTAAQYHARQKILPTINLLKEHYESIKKAARTNTGAQIFNKTLGRERMDGTRELANKQMNDWFERVVLQNYGVKHSAALGKEDEKANLKNLLRGKFGKKVMSKEEAKMEKEILEEASALDEKASQAEQAGDLKKAKQFEQLSSKLKEDASKLGKNFSFTSIVEGILNHVRFLGLGFNIPSAISNYTEGQFANSLLAALGDNFNGKHLTRANSIIRSSTIKLLSGGKVVPNNAAKVTHFMNKFRVLQDSSNELQKATRKSRFSKFSIFAPYKIVQRVEYKNQAPIMVSIMLNTPVTGIDGTTSNLWDATNKDGTLKDNFRTSENIANWENLNGKDFKQFSKKVEDDIVRAHGNYSDLRGMMLKSTVQGKALVLFKTWMTQSLHSRLAIEQDNLQSGIKGFKGRYRSHTGASAAITAGILATGTFGLSWALPMSAAGYIASQFFGVRSNTSLVKEIVFNLKALTRKTLLRPINATGLTNFDTSANMDIFAQSELTERDLKNYEANLTELSNQLYLIALLLVTKATLWDDEDEPDDADRIMHNILSNKLIQLSSNTTMYLNPSELYSSATDIAFLKFLQDVGKTIEAVDNYFVYGDDVIPTGVNAGESKFVNSANKIFLPSFARSKYMGFGSIAERQFDTTPFDKLFWTEEKLMKRELQGLRRARKAELIDEGYTEKEARRITLEEYPPIGNN